MERARCTLLLTLAFIFLAIPLVSSAQSPLQFIPITPCRIVDTRVTGNPIQGDTSQNFAIQGSQGNCTGIPPAAAAYSLNVTVVPKEPLGYLTVWPAGENQPNVSTLNSLDGRTKANAAIIGAGSIDGGAVSVFASNTTDLVLDLNGYFLPANGSTFVFYPLAPCRVLDTRISGQYLMGGQTYAYPVSGLCNVPAGAMGYSLNFTAVPHVPLGYLTAWPAGQSRPNASILNALTGVTTANAATIQSGSDMNGNNIDVFASNDTDLVIDVNGYFAPPGFAPDGLSLFTLEPCRLLDTRPNGQFSGTLFVNVVLPACGLPSTAQAVVVNATVVPPGELGYLTTWATGQPQPNASTLNAIDGAVTSNMAIVPTSDGYINAFASNPTQLVVDLFNYFAIPGGLNGNYTFSINGFNTPGNGGMPPPPCQAGQNVGQFMMVGSFVADGNGHVTGILDLNCANGQPVLNLTFTGTYAIQPNGLGTMTITPTLNTPFHLSLAVSSTGNGRLIFNNESTSYLPNAWGTGAISVQSPGDLSLQAIVGNYASGFSGVDPSLNRYAGAGQYQINQTQQVTGSADINDNGTLTSVLTSGAITAFNTSTGRGEIGLVTSAQLTHWVFYVTSANELTLLSKDPITSPTNLVLQTMLRQSTQMFDNTYLNGVGVVRTSGLSQSSKNKQKRQPQGGGSPDIVLGLVTTNGAGNGSVSLDENDGGTLTQQMVYQGQYSVASNGRVTLTGFGNNPPLFYLVNNNQAFVLGQDTSVASGFLAPQSGAPFSNASAIGTYWGGNYMPVTSAVADSVTQAFSDGIQNITGTNVVSGPTGTNSVPFTATYSIDSTGRMQVFDGSNLVQIQYVISPTRVAVLPFTAADTAPAVSVLGSTN